MRLAVVVPRYGAEVAGGAETAARQYAERLVAHPAIDSVEVLTTTARDATTWRNHYEPGVTVESGVTVTRFPVVGERAADFDEWGSPVLAEAHLADPSVQWSWVERQGPVAPDLIEAIGECDADAVAFHPYLFHPTVAGLPLVAERSVLHGAAHDEAPFRLPVVEQIYREAAGLAFWTPAERSLVLERFPVAATPQTVLGLGVEARPGDPDSAREALGVQDAPFVLCLGRVNAGKGTELLARSFVLYKRRRPGPTRLVFAGPVDDAPPEDPDIVVTGAVDETVKWGALRAASALVSPSRLESFAIVLLEAWAAGTPVLVNRSCAVTLEHVRRSGGGLAFGSFAELEVALDRLVGEPDVAAGLARNGATYLEENYRWPDLVDRYVHFLNKVADRAQR